MQKGILAPVPASGCYLFFSQTPGVAPQQTLAELAEVVDGESVVLGIGKSLLDNMNQSISGLHAFPGSFGSGMEFPVTPAALWVWVRANDAGEVFHLAQQIQLLLMPAFQLDKSISSFKYRDGNDLTGYEDGTENPKGEDAINAAFVTEGALAGSSFVAVQQWLHDFTSFEELTDEEQDQSVGRNKASNEELPDAPAFSHVKRTAQESFTPEAFLLRRSMPWVEGSIGGLVFVAFGHSVAAFEAQLKRMSGAEDGIQDGLFKFTRPVSGAYFWCPPCKDGCLDLSLLAC